ncbi:MAG: dihydropteroate synthase [Phycisphaerae bacterium]|nr:dihydropteroate synthase [Phycisphaerae bacterium]
MIIIGEKINATRKSIAAAISARDEQHIIATAIEQVAAGANYIDLNGGDPKAEMEVANMEWLVKLVQSNTDMPLCLDSANIDAIKAGLAAAEKKPIVNSVSLETERLEAFLPVLTDNECMVIALCMSDEGMPAGTDDRVERAGKLIEQITALGKKTDEIIIDPCFVPVSTDPQSARNTCEAIRIIHKNHPEVHIGGGLSNTSFGLPGRKFINLAMMATCIYFGMDSAIVDPCTPNMVSLMLAGEVLGAADEWCANYVTAHREGKLK